MENLVETKKQDAPQGELFNEICTENLSAQEEQSSSNKEAPKQFILSFDKFLVFILFIIIVMAVAYAFGVASGRGGGNKGEIAEEVSPIKIISEPQNVSITEGSKPEEAKGEEKTVASVAVLADKFEPVTEGGWTIQVVTYTDPLRAREEVAKLRDEGFKPFIIPSGKYHQVCVNRFKNRSLALKMLPTFTRSGEYFDAYVRKVKKS